MKQINAKIKNEIINEKNICIIGDRILTDIMLSKFIKGLGIKVNWFIESD